MSISHCNPISSNVRTLAVLTCAAIAALALTAPVHAAPPGGGGNMARSSVSSANRDLNQGSRNVNINHTDVNVSRNVDVDIDVDHHYGRPHYGAAVAAAAVTTAIVVGATYYTLPPNCTTVIRSGVTYYYCGGYYYRPTYVGSTVTYVVVNP